MKKIIFIAVSVLTALFASCNMDKFPHNSILESEGIQTMADAEALRVSIYTPMKSLLGGGRYTLEELRGGMFHASIGFGNNSGDFYRWEMQATSSEAESLWYGDYAGIASINFAIEAYDKLLNAEESAFTEKEKQLLAQYRAEAHVTRAMLYWDLVTKYCKAYDPATAETELGLPLQTVYNPTSDVTKYPGRSSLKETYELICNDLFVALDITTPGVENSFYYTKDVVNALLARVQLNMKDWANAAVNAQKVIGETTYALASDANSMEGLFNSDRAKEILFVVAGSALDPPTSTGSAFINDSETGDGSTPDPLFFPTKTLVDLYDKENDLRYPIFFRTKEITEQGAGTEELEILWKFVGNTDFQITAGKLNYTNAGKIRLAEMYLTLAEAAANMGSAQLSVANEALKTLRAARIENYAGEDFPENRIMGEIKNEWTREFVGEGFRMINMKRWNQDVVFGDPQNAAFVYRGEDIRSFDKPITHDRAIWPIPKKEMDINPQIKGQQNKGY